MKLEWPIKGELKITQKFKENPQNYAKFGLAGHDGTDCGCPNETPLYSPMDGKTYVGWAPTTWGLYYAIENDWGTCYLCHLKENFCPSDSQVTRGQLIGKTNNTGNSTGPHLHIGLRVKGISDPPMKDFVDPLPYFQEPVEEKIYTEAEMTDMRLQRDNNWRLYEKTLEEVKNVKQENEQLKKDIVGLKDQIKTLNDAMAKIAEEDRDAGLKELEAEKKLAEAEKELETKNQEISQKDEKLKGCQVALEEEKRTRETLVKEQAKNLKAFSSKELVKELLSRILGQKGGE